MFLPTTFFACCVYRSRLFAWPVLFYLLPWQFSVWIGSYFSKYTDRAATTTLATVHEMRAKLASTVALLGSATDLVVGPVVGVLISELHPCTRGRKSSFTERSFIIARLSVQFPEVPKVRVNSLIFFSHLFFHCSVDWFLRFHCFEILTFKLNCGCRGQSSGINSVYSVGENLALEQSSPENY